MRVPQSGNALWQLQMKVFPLFAAPNINSNFSADLRLRFEDKTQAIFCCPALALFQLEQPMTNSLNELNEVWHSLFWLIFLLWQPKNWIFMAKKELKFLSKIQNLHHFFNYYYYYYYFLIWKLNIIHFFSKYTQTATLTHTRWQSEKGDGCVVNFLAWEMKWCLFVSYGKLPWFDFSIGKMPRWLTFSRCSAAGSNRKAQAPCHFQLVPKRSGKAVPKPSVLSWRRYNKSVICLLY